MLLEQLNLPEKLVVRKLNRLLECKGNYSTIEELDDMFDRLKNLLSDRVLTILMKEDREQQKNFMNNP